MRRRIIVSTYMALDGVVENPQWTMPYWADDIARFKRDELFSVDALLLGRTTYEGFAAAWPGRTDEAGYADRINTMPKYVVSTTLMEAKWHNTTVIAEDVLDTIAALRASPGRDLLIFGSVGLTNSLMNHDMIDEFRVQLYPIVVGKGETMFAPRALPYTMKLVRSQTFSSGMIALIYEPERIGIE